MNRSDLVLDLGGIDDGLFLEQSSWQLCRELPRPRSSRSTCVPAPRDERLVGGVRVRRRPVRPLADVTAFSPWAELGALVP